MKAFPVIITGDRENNGLLEFEFNGLTTNWNLNRFLPKY